MPDQIDHINGKKDDNRIENLRPADYSSNQVNTANRKSASGIRGVRVVKKTGRWMARVYKNGKEIRVGTFATPEEASSAYRARMLEMYGEFVR